MTMLLEVRSTERQIAPCRICPGCDTRKPWTDYHARRRSADGEMLEPHTYCKPCTAAQKRARRAAGKDAAPKGLTYYPVGPFADWLRTLGDTTAEIAWECGICRDQLYDYLDGRTRRVSIDTVDRACIHAGHNINDLYPYELYHNLEGD